MNWYYGSRPRLGNDLDLDPGDPAALLYVHNHPELLTALFAKINKNNMYLKIIVDLGILS